MIKSAKAFMATLKYRRRAGNLNLISPAAPEHVVPAPVMDNPVGPLGKDGRARAGSPPRRAGMKVRLTLEGAIFIVTALLIGLAATNTGANLLYLVLAMMLAMLIVSGLMARANIRRLSVLRRYPQEFHAGQSVRGQLEIQNGKRFLSSYAIMLEDEIIGPLDTVNPPVMAVQAYALAVPAGGRVACGVDLSLPNRGLYAMHQTRMISGYPFSFLQRMRAMPQENQVLVLPRLLPEVAVLPFFSQAMGEIERSQRGMGSSLYGIRNYQTGDPSRDIHWKLSAKGQGLKLKEFEREESRAFRVMLDLRCPVNPTAKLLDDFEDAISVAATLTRMLMKRGGLVEVWTSAGNIALGTGPAHQLRIFRTLAQIQPQLPDAAPVLPNRKDPSVAAIWVKYQSHPIGESGGMPIRPAPGSYEIDAREVAARAGELAVIEPV